jgi:hypothetical protein
MTPRALFWRIFATAWLVYTLHWAPWVVREHFPAVALASEGTLNVERYLGWSEDIFPGPRGGAYINNNPGASIAAAVPLAALGPVWRALSDKERPSRLERGETTLGHAAANGRMRYFLLAAFFSLAFLMAPLSALAAALLGRRLAESGVPAGAAAGAALIYAFGTPVFFRTSYLNHNLIVCQLGLIAFLLLERNRAFASGLLAGYTVLCDFTGIFTVAALGLYSIPRRRAIAFGAGAIPGGAALIAYQLAAFGNPFRPSQHYMTPTAPTAHGYRGLDWPSVELAWANFFDPRFGLFVYAPLLLLAPAALWMRRGKRSAPAGLILGHFAALVVFCAANRYSWLQPATGMRYLIPAVPGLLALTLEVLRAAPGWARALGASVMVAMSWAVALTYSYPGPAIAAALSGNIALPWAEPLADAGFAWARPAQAWLSTLVAAALFAIWAPAVRIMARSGPGK